MALFGDLFRPSCGRLIDEMGRATYCLNGHFLDHEPQGEMDDDDEWPVVNARLQFCSECGAKSVRECENCHSPIVIRQLFSDRPSFCSVCGAPFPWTVMAINAANEFTDELELSEAEKLKLKETFTDLTADTPRTEVAAHRFRNFMKRIGPTAADVLTKIMVNVATEAARKGMGM